jgi:molecular chaperone DnaK
MRHVDECVRAAGGPALLDGEMLEAELRDRCEQAKRALSTLPDTVVRVTAGGQQYDVEVNRLTFESLTRALLRRTEEIVTEVLADSGDARIGAALLVGGSTRMPMVPAMIERVTGVRADRSVHPDEAVALGAAIQADALARRDSPPRTGRGPVDVLDVTSQSLGLLARSTATGRQTNSIVIPRNTPIPCEGRRRYRTLAENQREILLEVTEGDDEDPRYVTIVGSAWVAIPPRPESLLIDIVMSYDEDGMIGVSVVEAESDRPIGEFGIDRQANLDEQEVDRMREALRVLHTR